MGRAFRMLVAREQVHSRHLAATSRRFAHGFRVGVGELAMECVEAERLFQKLPFLSGR
jgi:hypothetical protein